MSDLIKIEEFTSLLSNAPTALEMNKNSIMACNAAGQALLDTIEGEGMNDELDVKAAEYIKKVNITTKKMYERRAPITQIFDRIRSVFTTDEKTIDPNTQGTIPYKIVQLRNKYATQKREEEKKRQEEAIRAANIEKEKVSFSTVFTNRLHEHYNNYFTQQSNELTRLYNTLTLNAFDLKVPFIKDFSLVYPKEHYDTFKCYIHTSYIDQQTKDNIAAEILKEKYHVFAEQYKFDMGDLRQSYMDRLPSKKKELIEEDTLRRTNEEAAKRAEEQRRLRELEEQRKIAEEQARKDEQRKVEEKQKEQVLQMDSLFAASAANVSAPATKVKVKERIEVLHPNGFLEIYQMWWMREGSQLPMDELAKIHKKMITFCEKVNNKENTKIDSKFIKYVEEVKAS